jgi:hypothetical protein
MHDWTSIIEMIDRDLREHPGFFNPHDVDLAECRVTPTHITCANSFDDNRPIELWLVLREAPASEKGYLVVFDEVRGTFGLAVPSSPKPVFLGWNGSFTETLAGM